MTSAVASASEDFVFCCSTIFVVRFAHGLLARSLVEFQELRGVCFFCHEFREFSRIAFYCVFSLYVLFLSSDFQSLQGRSQFIVLFLVQVKIFVVGDQATFVYC